MQMDHEEEKKDKHSLNKTKSSGKVFIVQQYWEKFNVGSRFLIDWHVSQSNNQQGVIWGGDFILHSTRGKSVDV